MHLSSFLLALAGYRPKELADYPYAVTHRRLCLGALVAGSALTGATLFGIAISRIDPGHPLRFLFGSLAGSLYFCMLLAFDALFVVGTQRAKPWAIAGRVILSLLMTAFSSMTLDAIVAGKRLDAEIDSRRLEADLVARSKHGAVHDLDGKAKQLNSASTLAADLEQRLGSDPTTPEFTTALSRAKTTEARHRTALSEVEPQLTEVRSQLAQLQVRLSGPESTEERNTLRAQMSELRVRRDALSKRLQDAEREASASAATVSRLRESWRSEMQVRLESAHAAQGRAREQLDEAQRRVEQGAQASRQINETAFEANIVEQSAAYWSLASRDHAYLAVGIAAWLGCLTLELLAVLVKFKTPPDALDEARAAAEQQLTTQRETEAEYAATVGRTLQLLALEHEQRQRLAKSALQDLAQIHDLGLELVVEAWLKTQAPPLSTASAGPRAAVARNFEALQNAMGAKVQQLLGEVTGVKPGDAAPTADLGPEPEPVPL